MGQFLVYTGNFLDCQSLVRCGSLTFTQLPVRLVLIQKWKEDQGLNGFAFNLHLQFHLLLLFATVPVLQPGLTCHLFLIILNCLVSLRVPSFIILLKFSSFQIQLICLRFHLQHVLNTSMCLGCVSYLKHFILTTILQNRFYFSSIPVLKNLRSKK